MKYKNVDKNTFVISLAPGEEIIAQLNFFLEQESINNCYFIGIGALKKAELAHYRVDTKKYSSKVFEEAMELTNMTGNAFLHDGKPLVHAHVTLADDGFATIGGHLVSGVISAACEILLKKLDSKFQKKHSHVVGLKILNI